MTDSITEVKRILLTEEERNVLSQHVSSITEEKNRYTHLSLQKRGLERKLEELVSKYSDTRNELESELERIEVHLHEKSAGLQSYSKDLMNFYEIDPTEGY